MNRGAAEKAPESHQIAASFARHNLTYSYAYRKFPIEPATQFLEIDGKKEDVIKESSAKEDTFLRTCGEITGIKDLFSLFAEIAALARMGLPGELRAKQCARMKSEIRKISWPDYTGGKNFLHKGD